MEAMPLVRGLLLCNTVTPVYLRVWCPELRWPPVALPIIFRLHNKCDWRDFLKYGIVTM